MSRSGAWEFAGDTPKRRVSELRQALLRAIAADRGCVSDDLSAAIVSQVETALLSAYRLGEQTAEDTTPDLWGEDATTPVLRRPKG